MLRVALFVIISVRHWRATEVPHKYWILRKRYSKFLDVAFVGKNTGLRVKSAVE